MLSFPVGLGAVCPFGPPDYERKQKLLNSREKQKKSVRILSWLASIDNASGATMDFRVQFEPSDH